MEAGRYRFKLQIPV